MSDYFSGYHLPCVAVSVYETISCEDMANEILSELNQTFDYMNLSDEDEQLYKDYCNELKAKGKEVFIEQNEELNEDDECNYAYFSIINPVFVNGLTFLNS